MSKVQRSAGRRLGLITIDQGVAGASNVVIAVLAARLLSPSSFGLFGIVFLVYVVLQGVSRALVSDPLLVHPVEAQERPNDVIATSALLGLGLAGVTLGAGFVTRIFNAELGTALIVLAAFFPLLVLQDLGRYLGFATQRPLRSLVLDLSWLVLVIAAVAVLVVGGAHTLPLFIAAWAGTGAVSGLLLFVQYRHEFRPHLSLSWLKYTWTFSWRYLISYGSTQGVSLAASSVVGAIVGARQLGGVQGSILLVRPFGTFQIAAVAAGVSEISRSEGDYGKIRRHAFKTTTLTATVAVINVAILLALPDSLGKVALGATWHVTKPLILPTGVQIVFLGILTGPRSALLGMRLIRRAMIIDVATAVVFLSAMTSGVIINGALGALWAVAGGTAVIATTWWTVMLHHTRHAKPVGRHRRLSGVDAPVIPEQAAVVSAQLPTTSPPLA